jgi:hypothetical protein
MEPVFERKELQAFVKGCEHLISSSRLDRDLTKEECGVVQFYLSELLTIIKEK